MATWSPKEQLSVPVRVSVGIALRIKNEVGIDLLGPEEKARTVQVALLDVHTFMSVMAITCESALESSGVKTKEAFMDLFDIPDAFPKAREAFDQAVIDFFRECGRADLAAAWEKMEEIITAAVGVVVQKFKVLPTSKILKKLEEMDIVSELERTLDRMPTSGS